MHNDDHRPEADAGAPEEQKRGMSRRTLLGGGAALGAAFFAAHATGDFGIIKEAAAKGALPPAPQGRAFPASNHAFDDEPFDPEAVSNGSAGWSPTIYGAGDQLGAINEITPLKTLQALSLIKNNPAKPPKTYNLGEILEEGFPAYGTRTYSQTRVGPGAPAGGNMIVGMEETYETTYQIATQLDGLPHIGVNDTWYNGFKTPELIEGQTYGSNLMGQEMVPPFLTRGLLVDILGLKVEQGDSEALGDPVDGQPILANSYRITVEDIEAAMKRGKTGPVEPGDIVLFRTGWSRLVDPNDAAKKARYLATEPGIYLREARWLAQFRPAIVASDTWALEVLPAPAPWSAEQFFPVHQELITRHGIRIGEAMNSEEMAADGVSKFIFFYTGQRARGATAANVAPGAIAQDLSAPPSPPRRNR